MLAFDRFSPEFISAVYDYLNDDVPCDAACEAAGIPRKEFYGWMDQGTVDQELGLDTKFSRLKQQVAKIVADNIRKHIIRIREGQLGWQGSAWILERRLAKYFSKDKEILDLLQDQVNLLKDTINNLSPANRKIVEQNSRDIAESA